MQCIGAQRRSGGAEEWRRRERKKEEIGAQRSSYTKVLHLTVSDICKLYTNPIAEQEL